jgi:hypothetical protein
MKITGLDNGAPTASNVDFYAMQRTTQATNPYTCSHRPDSALDTNTDGDFTVIDAQPPPTSLPTSKDQCKNGGWKTFGVFKNQGDCVSFVATGGKKPAGQEAGIAGRSSARLDSRSRRV